jgi:hypothetical protein
VKGSHLADPASHAHQFSSFGTLIYAETGVECPHAQSKSSDDGVVARSSKDIETSRGRGLRTKAAA